MPGKSHKPKSRAQVKWAFAAEERGELKSGTGERWAKSVKGKKLPARVGRGGKK
jgi:hypothetical protein